MGRILLRGFLLQQRSRFFRQRIARPYQAAGFWKDQAVNTDYKLQDVVTTYKVSADKLASSGAGIYSSLHARKSTAGDYRATLRVSPRGVAYLELNRWTSNGMKGLAAPVKLGFSVAANQQVNIKLEVTGKPSVNVRAKAWPVGSKEPAGWNTSATDSSKEALTAPGTVEVSAYRGNKSPAATLSYDDLVIAPMKSTSAANTAPVAPTTPPSSSSDGYVAGWGTPVWQDEFSGALSKWTVRDDATHGVLSYDRAIIKKENASTKDGVLTIKGKRMNMPVVKSGTREFSTGYIDSIGKFSQKYGRWEMRAQLPLTKAMPRVFGQHSGSARMVPRPAVRSTSWRPTELRIAQTPHSIHSIAAKARFTTIRRARARPTPGFRLPIFPAASIHGLSSGLLRE
nr:hypothetical protein [Arthrobacter sp. JCM 19049]